MDDTMRKDKPPLTGTQAWRQYGFTRDTVEPTYPKKYKAPKTPIDTGFTFDGHRWRKTPKGQRPAVLWDPGPNWRPYWIRERPLRIDQEREEA